MQPIFTLQFGEYAVANYLKEKIKNVSVFIPTSAQEKGIDLILYSRKSSKNKVQTIQVKMSRSYDCKKKKGPNIYGFFWFNTFVVPENADWIVLIGITPVLNTNKNPVIRNLKYEYKMICMSNAEAKKFMSEVKTKKGNPDKMFGFGYTENDDFVQTRGYPSEQRSLNKYKIENRLNDIKSQLI